MPLAPGTHLGPYEILAPIGAGGMGEVYRAKDTKLKRDVALKVLPEAFANDPERMTRFQREAEVLASLNHPNIAAVYGVEERALIMELVEGDSPNGPMPFDEAWRIASQIAAALEFAHDKGIVHRDLKPSNLKITPDGVVKLLDFGLAKAFTNQREASPSVENSPTLTIGATEVGVILGTAAYMSPEQAKGKSVDKRADIWAFGVVLYELLTGERLFKGDDVADTLANVLKREPDWDRVPFQARRLLHECLKKELKHRLRDIGDAKCLLDESGSGVQPAAGLRPGARPWLWPSVATVLLLVAAGVSFIHFRERPQQPQVLRYTIAPPGKTQVTYLAVSPDGRYVALTISGDRGAPIWVRALDSVQAQPLSGTEDATNPFWSPDSRYIGFFAQGKLKKIAVAGGPAQTLCDALATVPSGTWNRDGVIVFGTRSGLSRVSAAGGAPAPVTTSVSHAYPVFLPDGHRLLYVTKGGKDSGIYLASLDSKENRRLVPEESNPQYLPPTAGSKSGHLLFVREQTLMAQPLDPTSLAINGDVFPVAEQVSRSSYSGYDMYLYSISGNGMLVYQTGARGGEFQHAWFDRAGKQIGIVGGPVRSNRFALSPDGKRVVIERLNAQSSSSDLWIYDLEHHTELRFTFDASSNSWPVWSPDGSRVVFNSNRSGTYDVYQKVANGAGQDEPILETQENKFPFDWSRDGRFLIYVNGSPKTNLDIWALPIPAGSKPAKPGDAKPVLLVQTPFREWMGQVSADGQWLAYVSDDSGQPEVYVQPFSPENTAPAKSVTGKWKVSIAGGGQPRWSADGKELFYVTPDRKLMSVEVKTGGVFFERTTPRALFELRANVAATSPFVYRYAPSADGKRFLVSTDIEASAEAPPLVVVVNWLEGVKK